MPDEPTDESLFIEFTAGPEAEVPLPPGTPPPKDPARRYTVAEEIGKGGMAEIHRAVDLDLRRIVAMKAMRGDQPMGLFIREARLTAQLEHPNIVPIHDVGMTGEKKVFFTMKLVGGRTFHEVLDEAHRGERDPDARNNRGNIRFMLMDAEGAIEDLDEAIADYTRAVELNPGAPTNTMNRGVAHYYLGRHDRAIEDYTRALQVDPDDVTTLTYRAAALTAIDRFDEARDDCDRAIRIDPTYALAFQCRGNARAHLNDLEGAAADFARCLELDPDGEGAESTRDSLKRIREALEY